MNRVLFIVLIVLTMSIASSHAQIVDDFSKGGWTQFMSTPGRMSVETGKLRLKDGPEPPGYITVSKTFTVDIDKTPFFVVKVSTASDRGTVKLIRKDPYDKREAIEIDRPGLYAIDMRREFGWQGTAAVETCLYAIGDEEEITYEYVKYAERLTQEEEALIKSRAAGPNVRLNVAPFEVVPLFNACSFYFKSPNRSGLSALYRRKGGEWLKAFQPVYVKEDGMFRGSIVDLDEDTPYELKIADADGDVLAQQDFRTWRSEVPIAKTIVLDETNFTGRFTVKESGSPDGWIKVTGKEGFVLRNDRTAPLIEMDGAKYVLIEGLTLRGGFTDAISIKKCEHVRIVNCDIAGWGRIGAQRFDLDGKYYTPEGRAINWDSAILVSKSIGTVVERCYIHDPVSAANSWYYSHPAGPQAVGMDKPRSTVVRYNDFIGSDQHRWNDAIEGAGNFHLDGGFNRDADIYGNLMCFANDDAIEIDGGQTNVRVFLNKFEGCLCGVSIQGCMSGPSYVFRNLLVNMGDERGVGGQTIKTSSHANGPSAVSFIFGNTCYGDSGDLGLVDNMRIVAKNNIFAGRSAIGGRKRSPQSECDYNLLSTGEPGDEPHGILGKPGFVDADAGLFTLRETSSAVGRGVVIDNFAPGENGRVEMGAIPVGSDLVLPVRPIPITLDRYQIMFSASDVKEARAKTVSATVGGEAFSSRYRIAKNDAFDWLDVAPKTGVLESGKTVTFTVTLLREKMTERTIYRGAFLIRLESGYSRPVMVYAKTDVVPAAKPAREGVWVAYIEAEAPTGGKAYDATADPSASGGKCILLSGRAKEAPAEYRFSAPKAGKYFVLLRIKSDKPAVGRGSVHFSVDDGAFDRARLRSAATWSWTMAAHNRQQSLTCLQAFDLTAGEHILKLAPGEALYVDLVAITDNPGLFE
ncbi:MAG: right-handed parallel beta-helix repeat-containing protein [Planctomycetota bacterium]